LKICKEKDIFNNKTEYFLEGGNLEKSSIKENIQRYVWKVVINERIS